MKIAVYITLKKLKEHLHNRVNSNWFLMAIEKRSFPNSPVYENS